MGAYRYGFAGQHNRVSFAPRAVDQVRDLAAAAGMDVSAYAVEQARLAREATEVREAARRSVFAPVGDLALVNA